MFDSVWPIGRVQECVRWKASDNLSHTWQLWVTKVFVFVFFRAAGESASVADRNCIVLITSPKWLDFELRWDTNFQSITIFWQVWHPVVLGHLDHCSPWGLLKIFWTLHRLVLLPSIQMVLTWLCKSHFQNTFCNTTLLGAVAFGASASLCTVTFFLLF